MGHQFRLDQVNQILEKLESDDLHYTGVRGRYSKVSGGLSAALTSAGVATMLIGPGAVVGLPVSVVGSIIALVSVGLGVGIKSLSRKITKHDRTIQLIESKKSTIANLLSKALSDDIVDEREFTIITHEFESYNNLRMEIRHKSGSKKSSK